jgi:enoyl-CoA hydratase/carnithine racemase
MNAPATPAPVIAADDPLLRGDERGVATLTLNRPRQFNAIDDAMLDRLGAELEAIRADERVRVVVIRGAGPAFSGGHDLKQMMGNRTEAFIGGLFARCSAMMQSLQSLPQPVIARVHGTATAAGCQLVAACDLAVAASDARFATSGVNFGVFCSTPAVPLSRNIARKRAFEMLFTGDFIDAPTALAWGLVNRVVPADALDAEVARLAAKLAEKPRAVVAAGKALFYRQLEQPQAHAYAAASESITRNMLGADAEEGVRAFMEKRKPNWPASPRGGSTCDATPLAPRFEED